MANLPVLFGRRGGEGAHCSSQPIYLKYNQNLPNFLIHFAHIRVIDFTEIIGTSPHCSTEKQTNVKTLIKSA